MNSWAKRNGLGDKHTNDKLNDGHVKRLEWGSGSVKGLNTHYSIDSMGHTWPDGGKVRRIFFLPTSN